jgi:hypothetical protein
LIFDLSRSWSSSTSSEACFSSVWYTWLLETSFSKKDEAWLVTFSILRR